MQEIVELDSLGKQISEKICEYCKPLMLQKEERKERTRLLSCETDIQLSLQYALEAESAADCIAKLKLTKEECEIIVYTLKGLKQKTALTKQIGDLAERLSALIDKFIAKADN